MTNCPNCGDEAAPGVYPVKDPSTGPPYEVRLGQYLITAWETFKLYPVGFIGFSLIILIVLACLILLTKSMYLIRFLLIIAISPIYTGNYIVSAKLLHKQPCNFADFFSGFHYYQPLIMFNSFFVFIGVIQHIIAQNLVVRLILILVNILFFIYFMFTPLLIIDRHLGWRHAMKLSWRTIQRRWPKFLGCIFLAGLVLVGLQFVVILIMAMLSPLVPASFKSQLGSIALVIYLTVTFPWAFCAITAAYADLFGLQSQEF